MMDKLFEKKNLGIPVTLLSLLSYLIGYYMTSDYSGFLVGVLYAGIVFSLNFDEKVKIAIKQSYFIAIIFRLIYFVLNILFQLSDLVSPLYILHNSILNIYKIIYAMFNIVVVALYFIFMIIALLKKDFTLNFIHKILREETFIPNHNIIPNESKGIQEQQMYGQQALNQLIFEYQSSNQQMINQKQYKQTTNQQNVEQHNTSQQNINLKNTEQQNANQQNINQQNIIQQNIDQQNANQQNIDQQNINQQNIQMVDQPISYQQQPVQMSDQRNTNPQQSIHKDEQVNATFQHVRQHNDSHPSPVQDLPSHQAQSRQQEMAIKYGYIETEQPMSQNDQPKQIRERTDTENTCPECGAANRMGSLFCTRCGFML